MPTLQASNTNPAHPQEQPSDVQQVISPANSGRDLDKLTDEGLSDTTSKLGERIDRGPAGVGLWLREYLPVDDPQRFDDYLDAVAVRLQGGALLGELVAMRRAAGGSPGGTRHMEPAGVPASLRVALGGSVEADAAAQPDSDGEPSADNGPSSTGREGRAEARPAADESEDHPRAQAADVQGQGTRQAEGRGGTRAASGVDFTQMTGTGAGIDPAGTYDALGPVELTLLSRQARRDAERAIAQGADPGRVLGALAPMVAAAALSLHRQGRTPEEVVDTLLTSLVIPIPQSNRLITFLAPALRAHLARQEPALGWVHTLAVVGDTCVDAVLAIVYHTEAVTYIDAIVQDAVPTGQERPVMLRLLGNTLNNIAAKVATAKQGDVGGIPQDALDKLRPGYALAVACGSLADVEDEQTAVAALDRRMWEVSEDDITDVVEEVLDRSFSVAPIVAVPDKQFVTAACEALSATVRARAGLLDRAAAGFFNAGVTLIRHGRTKEGPDAGRVRALRVFCNGLGLWWALEPLPGDGTRVAYRLTAETTGGGASCLVNLFGALNELHRNHRRDIAEVDEITSAALDLARVAAPLLPQLERADRLRLSGAWHNTWGDASPALDRTPADALDPARLKDEVAKVVTIAARVVGLEVAGTGLDLRGRPISVMRSAFEALGEDLDLATEAQQVFAPIVKALQDWQYQLHMLVQGWESEPLVVGVGLATPGQWQESKERSRAKDPDALVKQLEEWAAAAPPPNP